MMIRRLIPHSNLTVGQLYEAVRTMTGGYMVVNDQGGRHIVPHLPVSSDWEVVEQATTTEAAETLRYMRGSGGRLTMGRDYRVLGRRGGSRSRIIRCDRGANYYVSDRMIERGELEFVPTEQATPEPQPTAPVVRLLRMRQHIHNRLTAGCIYEVVREEGRHSVIIDDFGCPFAVSPSNRRARSIWEDVGDAPPEDLPGDPAIRAHNTQHRAQYKKLIDSICARNDFTTSEVRKYRKALRQLWNGGEVRLWSGGRSQIKIIQMFQWHNAAAPRDNNFWEGLHVLHTRRCPDYYRPARGG